MKVPKRGFSCELPAFLKWDVAIKSNYKKRRQRGFSCELPTVSRWSVVTKAATKSMAEEVFHAYYGCFGRLFMHTEGVFETDWRYKKQW